MEEELENDDTLIIYTKDTFLEYHDYLEKHLVNFIDDYIQDVIDEIGDKSDDIPFNGNCADFNKQLFTIHSSELEDYIYNIENFKSFSQMKNIISDIREGITDTNNYIKEYDIYKMYFKLSERCDLAFFEMIQKYEKIKKNILSL